MKMRTFAVVTFITLASASLAVAQEDDAADEQGFVPARFVGGLDAASEKIRFPNYKRDVTVYINCAARVSVTGEIERYFCLDYYGVGDTKFRQAAEDFIGKVEVSPALVNGEPRAVEMYFRIFFGRQGELYAAGVFPNWGDDAEKYGLEYEAPQRYNEDPPPPKCGSVAGLSRVEVNAEGSVVGEVDLMMSYGKPEHFGTCENWMTGLVRDGQYIPAHHQGKPVAATYVELGGDPEWFTLKKPDGL
jgi:hypothetical protein